MRASFRFTLVVSVALMATIPVLIVLFPMITRINVEHTDASIRELQLQAQLIVRRLSDELQASQRDLQQISIDPQITRALKSPLLSSYAVEPMEAYVGNNKPVRQALLFDKEFRLVEAYPILGEEDVPPGLVNRQKKLQFQSTQQDVFLLSGGADGGKDEVGRGNEKIAGIVLVQQIHYGGAMGYMAFIVSLKAIDKLVQGAISDGTLYSIKFGKKNIVSNYSEDPSPEQYYEGAADWLGDGDSGNTSSISLFHDKAKNQAIINRKITKLIAFGGVGIIVVIICSLIVGRWLTRPIKLMEEIVHSYGVGNYHVHGQSVPFIEFSQFIDVLNNMGRKVTTQFGQLKDVNQYLENANNNLRRISQVKDSFIANTSHELRTPIHGIIGIVDALMEGKEGDLTAKQRARLEVVLGSARRLSTLINDILDSAKLNAGLLELQAEPVNLRAVAETVVDLSQNLIGNKPVELHNLVPRGMPTLYADRNRLQQILQNLVGNALKFTHHGLVSISADEHDGMVQITVSDTGIGIPANKVDDIFKPFEQVDASTQRTYGGTGLGLSITRQLVELQGGKLWVVSEQGQGSKFIFSVPIFTGSEAVAIDTPKAIVSAAVELAEADAGPEANVVVSASDVVKSPKMTLKSQFAVPALRNGMPRVLVVDDEPVNHEVLELQLSDKNFVLIKATNGAQALEICFGDEPPDLMLLDVMMPGITGYEVCKKVREQFSPADLPVILLTAKNQTADMVEGFASGANDYLTKPFVAQELLARLKLHLELNELSRRLRDTYHELALQHESMKNLQTQMVQNEKMSSLGTLVAGVAHEINNPTNFVYGGTANLEVAIKEFQEFLFDVLDGSDGESLQPLRERFELIFQQLAAIRNGADRIKIIVTDLRTFSRVDQKGDKGEIILHESIQSTINLVYGSYKNDVNFVTDFDTSVVVKGLPAKLNQVFMNLVVNGVQAIVEKRRMSELDEPSPFHISVAKEGQFGVARFKDSGCGIPPDLMDKIFEPFFTTKPVGEGTGLGLAITFGIIKDHDGRIEVTSCVGEGTTFSVYLPLQFS